MANGNINDLTKISSLSANYEKHRYYQRRRQSLGVYSNSLANTIVYLGDSGSLQAPKVLKRCSKKKLYLHNPVQKVIYRAGCKAINSPIYIKVRKLT